VPGAAGRRGGRSPLPVGQRHQSAKSEFQIQPRRDLGVLDGFTPRNDPGEYKQSLNVVLS
jgi:hypothetical protein